MFILTTEEPNLALWGFFYSGQHYMCFSFWEYHILQEQLFPDFIIIIIICNLLTTSRQVIDFF